MSCMCYKMYAVWCICLIWHNGAYVHSLSRGATCHGRPPLLRTSGGRRWQVLLYADIHVPCIDKHMWHESDWQILDTHILCRQVNGSMYLSCLIHLDKYMTFILLLILHRVSAGKCMIYTELLTNACIHWQLHDSWRIYMYPLTTNTCLSTFMTFMHCLHIIGIYQCIAVDRYTWVGIIMWPY